MMWTPQIGDIVLFCFAHVTGYTDQGVPLTERRERPAIMIGGASYAMTLHVFWAAGDHAFLGMGTPLSVDAVPRGPGTEGWVRGIWWRPRPGQEVL